MPTAAAIRDAVIAQLSDQLWAGTGGAVSADKPVRTVQKYVGAEFQVVEGQKRGIAGRTPALRVRWAGTRGIRSTISRRLRRVETMIAVIVASDSHRSKDDRDNITVLAEATVPRLVAGRSYGMNISKLELRSVETMRDEDTLLAVAAVFTTRYWVDMSKDPGGDLMLSADGQIVPPLDPLVGPTAPTLTVHGAAGSRYLAYDLQVKYSGSLSDFSPWASVHNAPNALGGANNVGVSWPAYPGATGYVLRRRWSAAGGPTEGVIYTGTATSFTDDGTVAGDGNTAPPHGVELKETF
jgi:hypothetical protein